MRNSYNYWRAAHPLVFISCLLLIGVLIANSAAPINIITNHWFSLALLLVEILSLIVLNLLFEQTIFKGLFAMVCIISWGAIIQWNSSISYDLHLPACIDHQVTAARNWIIQKINSTIISKEANSFALALLIGVKMDMNKSLLNAYTQLGIIHIIAISGMHLDILFKTLTKITYHLPKTKTLECVELILLLVIIWAYCLIANASPSIVRASVFFSICIIGKFYSKSNFTLNSIAAGILLLILVNVQGIKHIGLQLSYSAVIGIHLLYKIIYGSIKIDNPIVRYLWSNCCVSLAAQIATMPILLMHFHKIASWVLVSNFIMVPLSNIMLYGLVLLLLLPQGWSVYFGSLISKYILFFNSLVQQWFISTKAENIYIRMNIYQVFGYYLLLLLVYLWIYQKKSSYLIVILGLFTGYRILKLFSSSNFMWKM
jgi:competence protein ComEC